MKKASPKQTRKKLKRKNQNQKSEDSNLCINPDIEREHSMNVKTNIKVPDNYMTGKNKVYVHN